MNILDAFYQTVHDAPGGCDSLAPRMGMSSAVLRNKANVNSTTNKPMFQDVDKVMGLTGDYRALHALALNHNHMCIPVSMSSISSDMAVLEMITKVWTTNGDVGAEVNRTLEDGRVEKHEVEAVKEAVFRTFEALTQMLSRLEGMAEK